jgi:hypothetical protein
VWFAAGYVDESPGDGGDEEDEPDVMHMRGGYRQGAAHARCLFPSIDASLVLLLVFFDICRKRRSHSKSFTGAQGIPKYKIELGGGEDGRVGGRVDVLSPLYIGIIPIGL